LTSFPLNKHIDWNKFKSNIIDLQANVYFNLGFKQSKNLNLILYPKFMASLPLIHFEANNIIPTYYRQDQEISIVEFPVKKDFHTELFSNLKNQYFITNSMCKDPSGENYGIIKYLPNAEKIKAGEFHHFQFPTIEHFALNSDIETENMYLQLFNINNEQIKLKTDQNNYIIAVLEYIITPKAWSENIVS
jgi:hypothetical protein